MSSMTHGTRGSDESGSHHRAPSVHSSNSSGSGSKNVKCIGRYILTGCNLGKGNFARVETAVHTLIRTKVAVKIIETDKIKEDYVRKNLLREAQLMRRVRHPNIIRLYETMKTNNLYCLVTEIAEGGELLSYVRNDFKEKKLSEATARPFIRQLVSALHHLHSGGIVHRDLKMENILLDKKKRNVKIVDFGLSNAQKPGSLLQTHCGSPEYAAPELFIPGREYGPEVDVWSLGVNMFAMLVGKLPFRSPRQGTKRRQRLLEQISAGLSESHEKELVHVSSGARDLIGKLLQPDPRRRAGLDEVMLHSWITKDGSQPLSPHRNTPPDPAIRQDITDLMSDVLQVSHSEIKETVRRDRCDWLAAIFNLLMDYPEGINVLRRLNTDDPEDQLVEAATLPGSMEHLTLSQDISQDQEVADILTGPGATVQHHRKYRHSLSGPSSNDRDYPSSTLPITKKERKRHHSHENHHHHHHHHPLGVPRSLRPVQPPPGLIASRRASIANPYASPPHQYPMLISVPNMEHAQGQVHSHGGHGHKHGHARRLPTTPNVEPYQKAQLSPTRPHSRAESAPDPFPLPWQPKLASKLHSPRQLSPHSSPPPPLKSPVEESRERPNDPLVSPLSKVKPPKRKTSLNPLRPKSVNLSKKLSSSMDTNLHSYHNMAAVPGTHTLPLNKTQVAPARRPFEGIIGAQLGWGSMNSMSNQGVVNNYEAGSATSIDIKPEIFQQPHSGNLSPKGPSPQGSVGPSPQASKSHFRSAGENLKVDPISGGELSRPHHQGLPHPGQLKNRSVSAKPQRSHKLYGGSHVPELTNSVGHMTHDKFHRPNGFAQHGEIDGKQEKDARRNSFGEFFDKLKKGTREKSASTTLYPKAL